MKSLIDYISSRGEKTIRTTDMLTTIIHDFFTMENCKKLNNEYDFQTQFAQFLMMNNFYVVGEVIIDSPKDKINEKLSQDSIEIDIVVYKDKSFFTIELKFENEDVQQSHVTNELCEKDKIKMKFMCENFSDIKNAWTIILTNSSNVKNNVTRDWNVVNNAEDNKEWVYNIQKFAPEKSEGQLSLVSYWDSAVQSLQENSIYTRYTVDVINKLEIINSLNDRINNGI